MATFVVNSVADDSSRWHVAVGDQPGELDECMPNTIMFSPLFDTSQMITLSGNLGALNFNNSTGTTIKRPSNRLDGQRRRQDRRITNQQRGQGHPFVSDDHRGRGRLRRCRVPLNQEALSLTNCTVSNSTSSYYGGGLYNYFGAANLTNCTFSSNKSAATYYGGGIYNQGGTTNLVSCTVGGDTARYGGGVYNNSGTVSLINTIVSGNTASLGGTDVYGSFTSNGHNLIGVTAGSTNTLNSSDVLNVLGSEFVTVQVAGNYGGPTPTMALRNAGPASHMGIALPGITTDQRGWPLDNPPDIGAFQTTSNVLECEHDERQCELATGCAELARGREPRERSPRRSYDLLRLDGLCSGSGDHFDIRPARTGQWCT